VAEDRQAIVQLVGGDLIGEVHKFWIRGIRKLMAKAHNSPMVRGGTR